jgi:hypothetical protein
MKRIDNLRILLNVKYIQLAKIQQFFDKINLNERIIIKNSFNGATKIYIMIP